MCYEPTGAISSAVYKVKMGCCNASKANPPWPVLTVDLPTGEVMTMPAPRMFAGLESSVRAKIPEAARMRIHAEDGELTVERYPAFLQHPSRLLVEALDVSLVRHHKKHRPVEAPSTSSPPPEALYIIDVDKGLLSVLRTESMSVQEIRSDWIQWECRVAVVGKKLVVTGGKGNARMCMQVDRGNAKRCTEMMQGRESHAVAVLGDSVYAIGGYASQEMRSCEVYSNNEWFPSGQLERCRSFHTALGFQGWIYVCGGSKESTIEVMNGQVWRLLPVQLPFYISRVGFSPASKDCLLITGGESLTGGFQSSYNQVSFLFNVEDEELHPAAPLPRSACFTHSGTLFSSAVLLFAEDTLYSYQQNAWTVKKL